MRSTLLAAGLALACAAPAFAQDADPRIEQVLAQVSAERLAATVDKLASFGTRFTLPISDFRTPNTASDCPQTASELRNSAI